MVCWTIPVTHAETNSLRIKHPVRPLPYSAPAIFRQLNIFYSHDISISLNNDSLSVMHQPVDQARGQGVAHIEEFASFPEGTIRDDHDRSNFITGCDNLEQQIATTLVDGQIAQLIEEEMTLNHEISSADAII
jgi:hypothetical protein